MLDDAKGDTMNIGIEIILSNQDDNIRFIKDIVSNCTSDDSKIYTAEFDGIGKDHKAEHPENSYTKEAFLNYLSSLDQLWFLSTYVLDRTDELPVISDYNDYAKSKCKSAVFCADSAYIDLYFKEERDISCALIVCEQYGYEQLSVKTMQNDGRERFSVW